MASRNGARVAGRAMDLLAGVHHRSNVGASSSRMAMDTSKLNSTTMSRQGAGQRAMSYTPERRAPKPAAQAAPAPKRDYPFAAAAIVRTTQVAPTANMSQRRPKERGIMAGLHAQLRQELDPTQRFTGMFSRNSPTRVPVGSVLIVETYSNASKQGVTSFSGVLLAIRRRGVSTSIVLRNIVSKTGVEVMFNIYSPLLKDVRIVQLASAGKDDRSGKLRRTRRAKLYYLRKDNRKLAGIGKSIVAHRQQQEAERAKRGSAPGLRRLRAE